MSLARDLLDQAKQLASKEPRRPKEASLRRAVSTAYYALFHLLIDASTRSLIKGSGRRELRIQLARSFEHGRMLGAAKELISASAKPADRKGWFRLASPLSIELTEVAQAFVDLQEARHDADYNLGERFRRSTVDGHLATVRSAFASWERVKDSEEARVFLLALLLKSRN
jgi:hypothetical protein